MPEETTVDPAATPPAGEPETFDAEYVAKLRKEAAKYRTEAKANADAAKRLSEIEEAQKSEAEKAAERMRRLEEDAAKARSEALRFKVAAKYRIDDEDAELFLTGSDEETLNKQAERLAGRAQERRNKGNVVPKEGTATTPQPDEMRQFARNLFERADS